MIKRVLKNPKLLERKPNLKLKPNHYHFYSIGRRIWQRGKAISNGKGWYV